jgi:ribonuclease T1
VQSGRQTTAGGSPDLAPPVRAQQDTAVLETARMQSARAVLLAIQQRNGEPPSGYVGGRIFENREHRLPPGVYREYDVYPKVAGRSRGAERIVIEQRTGKAYYSDDHYRTFIPMN